MTSENLEGKLRVAMTAAGQGKRLWPFGKKSVDSVVSKSMGRYSGIPLVEIQAYQIFLAGISEVFIIGMGVDNRDQLGDRLDAGSHHLYDLDFRFTHPVYDKHNRGSGDAIIRLIESFQGYEYSLIMANDNYYDFEISDVFAQHKKSGAVISMITTFVPALDTIGTYGVVISDETGRVIDMMEKPKKANELRHFLGMPLVDDESYTDDLKDIRVEINTAAYLTDDKEVRRTAGEDYVVKGRKRDKYDMAGGYVTDLVKHGEHVQAIRLNKWIDFGVPASFIDGFNQILRGEVPLIFDLLAKKGYLYRMSDDNWVTPDTSHTFKGNHVWIHPDTLDKEYEGLTLRERIRLGYVVLEGNVYIGRDVLISGDTESSVRIINSSIDKLSSIEPRVEINNSYISRYCEIGANTGIEDSIVALNVTTMPSPKMRPTRISNISMIGPSITIPLNTELVHSNVWPGYTFPAKGGRRYKDRNLVPDVRMRDAVFREYGPPE